MIRMPRRNLPTYILRLAEHGDNTGDYKDEAFRAEWRVVLSAIQCGWTYDETFDFLMLRTNQAGLGLHKAERKGSAVAHRKFKRTWDNAQAWIALNPAGDIQKLTTDICQLGVTLGAHPELFTGRTGTTDWIMVERIMGLIVFKAHRLTINLSTRQAMDIAGLGNQKSAADSLKRLVKNGILILDTPGHVHASPVYRLNLRFGKVPTTASYVSALQPPEDVCSEVGHLRPLPPIHDLFVSAAKGRDSIGMTALRVYELICMNDQLTGAALGRLGVPRSTADRATSRLVYVGLVDGDNRGGFTRTARTPEEVAVQLNIPPVRQQRRERIDALAEHWRSQRTNADLAVAGYFQRRCDRRGRAA